MKLYKSLFTAIFICIIYSNTFSQNKWNSKNCAVVLTYDDALNVHLDNVIPLLDSMDMKATFYVPCNAETLNTRQNQWKVVAKNGHELGNHTLFHPCTGKSKGRNWVSDEYDLDNYSINRIVDEIKTANTFLKAIDGKTERTFAYTCGDTIIGDSSYVHLIKPIFAGARGVKSQILTKDNIDIYNIASFAMSDNSGLELIDIVKQAEDAKGLAVFLFHGIGGEHVINTTAEAHRTLIQYLNKNKNNIWVAPMVEVAKYISHKN